MYALRLRWPRCRDGVEYFDRGHAPAISGGGLLGGFGRPQGDGEGEWLGMAYRHKSDNVDSLGFPMAANLVDPIVLAFVNARTTKAMTAFLSCHGLIQTRM